MYAAGFWRPPNVTVGREVAFIFIVLTCAVHCVEAAVEEESTESFVKKPSNQPLHYTVLPAKLPVDRQLSYHFLSWFRRNLFIEKVRAIIRVFLTDLKGPYPSSADTLKVEVDSLGKGLRLFSELTSPSKPALERVLFLIQACSAPYVLDFGRRFDGEDDRVDFRDPLVLLKQQSVRLRAALRTLRASKEDHRPVVNQAVFGSGLVSLPAHPPESPELQEPRELLQTGDDRQPLPPSGVASSSEAGRQTPLPSPSLPNPTSNVQPTPQRQNCGGVKRRGRRTGGALTDEEEKLRDPRVFAAFLHRETDVFRHIFAALASEFAAHLRRCDAPQIVAFRVHVLVPLTMTLRRLVTLHTMLPQQHFRVQLGLRFLADRIKVLQGIDQAFLAAGADLVRIKGELPLTHKRASRRTKGRKAEDQRKKDAAAKKENPGGLQRNEEASKKTRKTRKMVKEMDEKAYAGRMPENMSTFLSGTRFHLHENGNPGALVRQVGDRGR
ncbi:hypothetical protein BESB_031360 [Besnoitia besnoiti]|uniref:Uncharacterized protein n=1 Tax=Besnoitia besnoiti TaxID=94643 RepID=A0A2A9M7B6_BESBE|nr:hypothetical protein BESB_031360 [Besnoitia besnoiti]PFH31262.1 hypothetical protein BESB_031360 [Besnoitia besnoiti]